MSDEELSRPAIDKVEEELLFYFRGIPASIRPAATLAIKALHDMLREGAEPRVYQGYVKGEAKAPERSED